MSDDEAAPAAVEAELEGSRERLADLLDELDRRRDELTNVPARLRKHIVPAAIVGAALLTGAVALVAVNVRRRNNRSRFLVRAQNLREAFGRMARHPNKVAREQPNMLKRLLTAAATTVLTIMVKRLVEGGLHKAAGMRREREHSSDQGAGAAELTA